MIFANQQEKNLWLNSKRQEMQAAGMTTEKIEEQIDALSETNWTRQEWEEYYGGAQDDW